MHGPTTSTVALKPLNYSRSFIIPGSADHAGNVPRQWIDSRVLITDEDADITEEYLRTDLCVTERTFGAGQIFPERTWCGSRCWGPHKTWFFRHFVDADDKPGRSRQQAMAYDTDSIWGPITRHLVQGNADELTTDAAIIRATREGLPLVGQTEIQNKAGNLRATIEYPIKTMNTLWAAGYHHLEGQDFDVIDPGDREGIYQVDTGPVPFADLELDCEHHHERITLAHVAYNQSDNASFMLFAPRELKDDNGNTKAHVNGYHQPVLLPAHNRIFALKD